MIYIFICVHRLHVLGHSMSLSLCSERLKLYHRNYPDKYCVKHYLGTFAFLIRKIIYNDIRIIVRLYLLLTLICVRKILERGIHFFNIPIHN